MTTVAVHALTLLPADARARRTDVRHDHTGKAGSVEVRGDDVWLQLSILGDPSRAYGLPKRITLHLVRGKADVAPPFGTLQIVGALCGKGAGHLGGFSMRSCAMSGLNQLACSLS
jgi:hypothetical protein